MLKGGLCKMASGQDSRLSNVAVDHLKVTLSTSSLIFPYFQRAPTIFEKALFSGAYKIKHTTVLDMYKTVTDVYVCY